ncbi:hypothetical protein C8Q76DRAFT_749020 [Earliella scabrosa]|nr:hypothetical protein C8Q76DRAFT_749020 [Earliella scabrosa]
MLGPFNCSSCVQSRRCLLCCCGWRFVLVRCFQAILTSQTPLVLLLYEAIITFDGEVEYFWKSTFTGASMLYLLNKYTAVAFYTMTLVVYLPIPTDQICDRIQKTLILLELLQLLPWAAFSGLRVFALSKSWSLSALVLLLFLVSVGVNMEFNIVGDVIGYVDPISGCEASNNATLANVVRATIVSRVCMIVGDALVIVITLCNTSPRTQLTRRTRARSLPSILLRDGIACFAVLLALNVLHLVFTLFSIYSVGDYSSNVTVFTTPLTTILIGRFLLHLQESAARTLRVLTDDGQGLDIDANSRPSFVRRSRVMGSIGHRDEDMVEDEDEDEGGRSTT